MGHSSDAHGILTYTISNVMILGKHLILITKRCLAATINGEFIYAVESTEILPYLAENQLSRPTEEVSS